MKKKAIISIIVLIAIASIIYYLIDFQLELGKNDIAKDNFDQKNYVETFQAISLNSPEISEIKYEGYESAPLSIIFVADLNSRQSNEFYKNIFPELHKKYVQTGQAKLYHKYIISKEELDSKIGVYSKIQAARCFANLSTNSTITFQIILAQATGNDFSSLAKSQGVDIEEFRTCISTKEFKSNYLDMLETEQFIITSPSIYLGVNGGDNTIMHGTPSLENIYKKMRLKEIKVGLN